MADTFNYRIDHHGSLVRPPALLAARADGDAEALRAVEQDAVADAVAYQRKLRCTVVTDGDFPRADFRGAVLDAVSGFRRAPGETADGFARWTAHALPKAERPLASAWAARLREMTVIAPKVTLPSPAYLAATTFDPDLAGSGGPASARALGEALAEIVRAEVAALVAAGVRLIQLVNPLLAGHVAVEPRSPGPLPFADALAVDAAAVLLDERPEGVRIGLAPGWRAPDAVDRARVDQMYAAIPVDRWVLPFDQGTAAELDLVRALPEDRDACLGVVDATRAALEDIDTVMTRIDAAGEVKDLEDMAVAPSRGFADRADRPLLTAQEQHRKLVLVETIARYCWGNEF